ncbi:hypothetical protein E8E01_01695 [Methylorubrum populi]|nr:hypothetical protein E8E01_01695 [Methylorubrum populi]
MRQPERTAADWIAEGETAIALFCVAIGSGHDAILKLAELLLRMTRDRLATQTHETMRSTSKCDEFAAPEL